MDWHRGFVTQEQIEAEAEIAALRGENERLRALVEQLAPKALAWDLRPRGGAPSKGEAISDRRQQQQLADPDWLAAGMAKAALAGDDAALGEWAKLHRVRVSAKIEGAQLVAVFEAHMARLGGGRVRTMAIIATAAELGVSRSTVERRLRLCKNVKAKKP